MWCKAELIQYLASHNPSVIIQYADFFFFLIISVENSFAA